MHCSLGGEIADNPNPCVDWNGFVDAANDKAAGESLVWNPAQNRATPWIVLANVYTASDKSKGKCTVM